MRQSARVLAVSFCLLGAAAAQSRHRGADDPVPSHRPVRVVADQRFAVVAPAGQGLLPLYVSQDWQHPLPAITRAVLVIHGERRNAASYWRAAQAAAAAAGTDGTLMIAPQFLADVDMAAQGLGPAMLHWSRGGWMDGAPAHGPAPLSGFDALDAMVTHLADRRFFPALREIVIAGHSAGAQMVQRYAVLGRAEAGAGVALRYVVADPSSYAYFGPERPAAVDAAACPGFDAWKYGLHGLPPYAPAMTPAALEARYAARRVIYLLGQLDDDPNHPELDKSCAAEAQGATRLARGRAYVATLRTRHPQGLAQTAVEVPGVGHDGAAMLTSPVGLAALFGP